MEGSAKSQAALAETEPDVLVAVGPVTEAEEVPPGVGAGVGVLAGVGVVGVLVRVVAAGPVPEAEVPPGIDAVDVPTRVGVPARRVGAAGVPSGRPTSCFNIVAATSPQTDLMMKASNAHTRAKQQVGRCVALCWVVAEETLESKRQRTRTESTRIMIRVRLGCGLTGTWAKVLTVTKINCCKVRERCAHPTFDFSALLDCQVLTMKKH